MWIWNAKTSKGDWDVQWSQVILDKTSLSPEKLINNKEEWNQPGDVRIEFSQYGVKNRKVKGKNDRLGGEELEKMTREVLKRKEEEKVDYKII